MKLTTKLFESDERMKKFTMREWMKLFALYGEAANERRCGMRMQCLSSDLKFSQHTHARMLHSGISFGMANFKLINSLMNGWMSRGEFTSANFEWIRVRWLTPNLLSSMFAVDTKLSVITAQICSFIIWRATRCAFSALFFYFDWNWAESTSWILWNLPVSVNNIVEFPLSFRRIVDARIRLHTHFRLYHMFCSAVMVATPAISPFTSHLVYMCVICWSRAKLIFPK